MVKSSVSYATDQITIYRHCPYACRYCYVWRNKLFTSRVMRGKYDPIEEAKKYRKTSNRIIVVSFTSDPYPPEEEEKQITRQVLKILSGTKNTVMVLTKNPILAIRDVDIMRKGDIMLGTTITTLNNAKAEYWEPNAPRPYKRLQALQIAHTLGIRTWISLEPIIPGTTELEEIILTTMDFIDYYVLGAFNYTKILGYNAYSRETLQQYYRTIIPRIIEILERYNKKYHVKTELTRYLNMNKCFE